MPPSSAKAALKIHDKKVLGVILTCLEAGHDEVNSTTAREISFPTSSGGLGFPQLSETCQFAYFASVYTAIQTWKRFIKDTHPLLVSWCKDEGAFIHPLPQPLNNFNLKQELKSCLHHCRSIATQAVQAKKPAIKPTSKHKAATATTTTSTHANAVTRNSLHSASCLRSFPVCFHSNDGCKEYSLNLSSARWPSTSQTSKSRISPRTKIRRSSTASAVSVQLLSSEPTHATKVCSLPTRSSWLHFGFTYACPSFPSLLLPLAPHVTATVSPRMAMPASQRTISFAATHQQS